MSSVDVNSLGRSPSRMTILNLLNNPHIPFKSSSTFQHKFEQDYWFLDEQTSKTASIISLINSIMILQYHFLEHKE